MAGIAPKWMSIKRWLWPVRPHRCVYCDKKLGYKEATIDHFKPVANGGEHSDENCMFACEKCNNRKGETEFMSMEEAREFLRRKKAK